MVGDFVDTGGLLNVVEGISNSFSESGRSVVGGGISGISVGDGGRVVSGGGVSDIRVSSSSAVMSGGDINDVSGSLDLFTLVVVGGDGSSVSGGGVGRGDVGSEERFTEEIRVSEIALTSGGNDGRFNVMLSGGFNLVSSSGSVEVAGGHG